MTRHFTTVRTSSPHQPLSLTPLPSLPLSLSLLHPFLFPLVSVTISVLIWAIFGRFRLFKTSTALSTPPLSLCLSFPSLLHPCRTTHQRHNNSKSPLLFSNPHPNQPRAHECGVAQQYASYISTAKCIPNAISNGHGLPGCAMHLMSTSQRIE